MPNCREVQVSPPVSLYQVLPLREFSPKKDTFFLRIKTNFVDFIDFKIVDLPTIMRSRVDQLQRRGMIIESALQNIVEMFGEACLNKVD